MHIMFEGATAFTGDISKWEVSKVVSMDGMFQGATSFNSGISEQIAHVRHVRHVPLPNRAVRTVRAIANWRKDLEARVHSGFELCSGFRHCSGESAR